MFDDLKTIFNNNNDNESNNINESKNENVNESESENENESENKCDNEQYYEILCNTMNVIMNNTMKK